MTNTGNFTFKLRRGPAAEWTTDNPTLLAGEPGFEIDTNKLKIGNGIDAWNDLDYFPNPSDLVAGVSTVEGRTGDVDLSDLFAALAHAHAITDVTGLAAALADAISMDDLTAHTTNTSNPHSVTKTQVGLGNVNNTADADKPISTATAAALAGKAASSHAHATSDVTGLTAALAGKADTTHSHSMSNVTGLTDALSDKSDVGHGHSVSEVTGLSGTLTAIEDELDLKSDVGHGHAMSDVTGLTSALSGKAAAADLTSHTSNTSNPHSVTKAQVGLSNVDNTSDAGKPISTATQTALDGKSPSTHNHVTGPAVVTLTDASTIATDASLASHFRVTLGGDRTLGNPTNPTDGQRVIWEIIQDSTGNRALTLGSKFALGSDIDAFEVSVDANERDFMGAIYNSTADKWYVVALIRGY